MGTHISGRRPPLRERGRGRVCSTCTSADNKYVPKRDVQDTDAQLLPVSLPSKGERSRLLSPACSTAPPAPLPYLLVRERLFCTFSLLSAALTPAAACTAPL